MTTAVPNHKPERKQLSEQLDRFDAILDGFSDNLNEAVTDAAREGTRLALKDAIVELLTDPTLRARLHEASAPAQAARPTLWQRLQNWVAGKLQGVADAATQFAGQVTDTAARTLQRTTTGVQALRELGSLGRLLLLVVSIGLVVSVASYAAPHGIAAALNGLCGAVATAAIQISVWTRRTWRRYAVA